MNSRLVALDNVAYVREDFYHAYYWGKEAGLAGCMAHQRFYPAADVVADIKDDLQGFTNLSNVFEH